MLADGTRADRGVTFSKAGFRACLALAIITVSPELAAEPEFDAEQPRWEAGLGFAYRPGGATLAGGALVGSDLQILVPIQIGSHLRIEPAAGFSSRGHSLDTSRYNTWAWAAGIGGAYVWALDQRTLGHVGLRAARRYWRNKSSLEGRTEQQEMTGYEIGPLAGGEFFASSSLSLGIELIVTYARAETNDGEGETTILPSEEWGLRTDGLLVFRVYFWRFKSARD